MLNNLGLDGGRLRCRVQLLWRHAYNGEGSLDRHVSSNGVVALHPGNALQERYFAEANVRFSIKVDKATCCAVAGQPGIAYSGHVKTTNHENGT